MDRGWKGLEEMANENLNSFKGPVRASGLGLGVHSNICSSTWSSRTMPFPMKKWSFVSPPLEIGQAPILPDERGQNEDSHCFKATAEAGQGKVDSSS